MTSQNSPAGSSPGWMTRLKILWREIRDVSPRQNWGLARSPGVVYCGSRSYNRLVGGRIRKIYRRNQVARESFERDLEYARRFQAFTWSVPVLDTGITWLGQRWIEMDAFPQERRLDRCAAEADADQVLVWVRQILSAVLDLHCLRVAHRDLHGRNVFCLDDGVRLIDFDVAMNWPEWYRPRFSACYDLTGEGLQSPHGANHACLFADHFPYAIGRLVLFERDALLTQLRRDCEREARALMACNPGGDMRLWIQTQDGHMEQHQGGDSLPEMLGPGTEAWVVGTRCAGLTDALIRRGCGSIKVWERDAVSLHLMRRWIEACEIDGIHLFAGDEFAMNRPANMSMPSGNQTAA
jgi:serine/threonine protein kinase